MTDWDVDPDEWPHTPPLDEFLRLYEEDDNIWWRTGCGHHLNLFDAACERLDDAEMVAAMLVDVICEQEATVRDVLAEEYRAVIRARADERERIAQAQEKRAQELLDNEHHSYHGAAMLLARDLPQIARSGGRDE